MNVLTTLSEVFSLVETFGPLVPEVLEEVPEIASKAAQLATDVKTMNVGSTLGDLQTLVSAAELPFSAITKTLQASKTLTAPAASAAPAAA